MIEENSKITKGEIEKLREILSTSEYIKTTKLYSGLITKKTANPISEMFFYGLDENIKNKVKDYFFGKTRLTEEINKEEVAERFIRNSNSIFKVYTVEEIADKLTVELSSEDLDIFSYRLARCMPDGYDLCMHLLKRKDEFLK